MERRLSVAAAVAFALAAVLYSAWIPGEFTTPALDRMHGYLSELAARDQPWSGLFQLADAGAGLACLAGVALVPRIPREWLGWLGLAAFGLFTVGGALLPLDCASVSDPACERGQRSLAHHLHAVTSALSVAGVTVSMVLLSRTVLAWVITAASLAATSLALASMVLGNLAGLAQRAQLVLIALWLLYLAARLLTRCPPADTRLPHVLREGEGPAVLLCAGLGGAWFHWDEVAAGLAPQATAIRFDRPGLGLSPAEPLRPTLYGEAARLAALAPAHPEQVTVVAHSVAAWHAEAFARLHPLRVNRLVLVDPKCRSGPLRHPSGWGQTAGRWLPAFGGTWGAHAVARCAGPAGHRLLTGRADPGGVYAEGRVAAAVTGEWLAIREMAAELRTIREEHPFPPVPVVVISSGRGDACLEELAGLLGGTMLTLPGVDVLREDPAAIVKACLDESEPGPG
ncbi:alpha/beta fold hydrolase [Nonomuraea sp. NPDC050328]|uniref:alpha/beta fold hydrolase n=1 Tax=Nonomuraea sp. NPDC050328 TaxID=3364361 RepID=UPI00378766A9